MEKRKLISPRIGEKTQKWIMENFRSATYGAEFVLECNRLLYSRTLSEIKGKFSRGEIMAMVDVMNAHALTPFGAGGELASSLADSMAMEGLAEKWDIEGPEDFIARIGSLPSYSRACLEWWANGFWYGGGEEREERDIEKYVSMLL